MRKVVDSNFLQSDELRDYLSKSAGNYVVLTDYAAMEAYKGDTLGTIYRSMEILADYPKQVIVLKGTQVVCGLRGRGAGLQANGNLSKSSFIAWHNIRYENEASVIYFCWVSALRASTQPT